VSNGILDLLADSAVGLVSGQRRLENFEQRINPETLEDLLGYKQAMLNEMAPAYKEKIMEKQGVTNEMDLNIESSYDKYIQGYKAAQNAALADSMAGGLGTTAIGSFFAPFIETGTIAQTLIPGGVKPLSEEGEELFQSRRIKSPVDVEAMEEIRREYKESEGVDLGPVTDADIKAAEEFIYQNSPTSNIAYALGLLTEMKYPTLFVYKYGPKVAKAMYNFIKAKPKTTAAGAAAATTVTSSDAEALPIKKIKPKSIKPKSAEAKELEEIASKFRVDKSGAEAGTGQRTEVGKYPNIFDNLGLDMAYDRTGSYKPKTVEQANKILSEIDSPYESVKLLKDDILQPTFDKQVNKTLKKLKLNKDSYLTAKEIGLVFGLQNVEAWPKTMRTLTTASTKAEEPAAKAMSAIKKIDERGVGFGPGVKYHLGDTIDALKTLNQNRITRQATQATNNELTRTQGSWTRALINSRFNKIATEDEIKAIKKLTEDVKKSNKGKKKTDNDYVELDHIEGVQVSLMKNNMGREAFSKFLQTKNIDILDVVDRSEWTKLYNEFLDGLDETKVFNTIYNIGKPGNRSPIPRVEQIMDAPFLTKTKVFDSTKGGLYAKQESLIRVSNELADLQFLKNNANSISKRDLNYFIDTYGDTKKRKFAQSKDTFLSGVTKRINDLKAIIKGKQKDIDDYFKKTQELEAKEIKIPKLPEREKFVVPGSTNDSEEERMRKLLEADAIPGTIANSVKRSLEPVQNQIRGIYEDRLQPYFDPPLNYATLKKEELEKELSDRLNPPRPVKFKFSELPRLVTQSTLAQALTTDPRVAGLETIEFIYNSLRKGVANDIEMEEKFPKIYAMNEISKVKGPGATPKEADYLSAIDEINRAVDTGVTNFAYNVGDLLFSLPDALLPTEFTDELKRRYEKSDLARPETFVGQISAVALEFGIPGGIAFKLINRFRKFTAARTGGKVNLFAQKTYELEGLPKLGVQISNVAKRVGTGAVSFGAGDFVAGGPYNTISEMFDDPLLSSKLVGEYEDTSELSGDERVLANFKNRLRFAAEGAMIGGLFPLVGPALGAIGKQTLLKPALFLGGGLLKGANVLAIKPATYLASLDPVILPGIARGAGAFTRFLGQDVLARLAATAATGGRAFVPSLKGNFGQLPEFSKWRMFDVTSDDPLERGLKKVDNFLKWFRDSGNQALYGFNLSGGAERFIKAKSREIEKYLDSIEKKAYDLANGFLGRYNKGFTSPAGESQMLEQVFEYLRGNLKLSKIEPELQEMSKVLKDEFNALKQAYFKELPEGSGLKAALESNLDKYMRMSFATFTNPNFKPGARVVEQATDFMVDVIMRNEDFLEAAVRGVGATGQTAAIREFARKNVENIINIGKREGVDPINALNKINREILRGDDVFLQTGEELPQVIRNLLGQEKSLRNSVMMTTGALVSQTANIRSFKEFARHELENGYLFRSRAEALAAGVSDPRPIGKLPGLGPMQDLVTVDKDGPIGLFASNELKQTIEGTGGMLDNLLQNSFYQSLIAYKAAVQTGKTVFSPATQTRNFGSAGFFPMHVGHIGGSASVTDSFKIVMDDIFGAGRTVNEADLIKRISRKIELGVLDENIVASELGAILKDIKAGKLQSLGKLAERVENTKFYKQATRVYAGGDNVWKWYGHEYYMSQLKGAFRNIDDIKRFFEDIHGIEFNTKNIMTGATKTLDEGIEEAAAFLLRETYPTYSKVPEFIKAIRKLPIGNFVSFTSEILRTGFSTSAIAMKHIASDNQALREMGYRMLSGQAITLGGMTAGTVALGHALTNVTPTHMEVYKQYFAPEYMKYSTLIPVTNHKDGTFKVFDLSRYNPYDIIVSSSKELMRFAEKQNYSRELSQLKEQLQNLDPDSAEAKALRQQIKEMNIKVRMSRKLDPKKIQTNTLRQYLNAVGPLYDSVTGTFFGIPIGAEAFIEAYTGRTRQGSPIWSEGMTDTEIFDRAMGHFFKTIEPGIISSGRKLFYAARGDVSGVGQPLEVDTELFKLAGGSNVTVDILGSLDFKISDFQKSFREARVAKDFFSTENFKSRGPEQLVREYREQNEQAFRAQYEFYKAAMAAIDSGLLTRTQVIKALTNRVSPGSDTVPQKVLALMDGRYTALSYGPEGLKSRREKIIRNNADLDRGRYSLQYFLPFGALENEKTFWNFKKFSDFEERPRPERQREAKSIIPPKAPRVETEPEVPEIAETGEPQVQAAAPTVSPVTGLTTTETALLSPGEQAIRLRQRQTGIA
jgi:hypothetical protein